jgi:ABC-2 type transport system ATP-binding protein
MPLPGISDGREPAIELRGVGVRYRLPRSGTRSITEFALLSLHGRMVYDDFWALRDVDLQVYPGERIGVIGRNGAGKTTLLQVISRVVAPTIGTISLRGRVAPLLSLGAGFDPELTGRENIFLNGALLGIPRAELGARFEEIVEFAELAAFIDAPLRVYSAGMNARLGFAVATSVRPEILLLDEILAVGDRGFLIKCDRRMGEFAERGTTMMVVTHNTSFVLEQCTRAIWLQAGRVQAAGRPAEVVDAYHAFLDGNAPPGFVDAGEQAGGTAVAVASSGEAG